MTYGDYLRLDQLFAARGRVSGYPQQEAYYYHSSSIQTMDEADFAQTACDGKAVHVDNLQPVCAVLSIPYD